MALYQEYLPDPLPAEPLALAAAWLDQAVREAAQANPNAMVLATADQHGQPSARIVLCKEIRPQPGYLTLLQQLRVAQGHRACGQSARRGGDALGLVCGARYGSRAR